jgi:hypothetical protein
LDDAEKVAQTPLPHYAVAMVAIANATDKFALMLQTLHHPQEVV